MPNAYKLLLLKVLHTAIWVFYNIVIFYFLFAVITNKLDTTLWVCVALILLEGITLLVFRWNCPVTLLARRYSNSPRHNFDIYLPEPIARYNKEIYTAIVIPGFCVLAYRVLHLAG